MLHELATRAPVAERVALVVAHPDDETLAAGASLHLFPRLVLVHVTDGAPLRLDDAAAQGFATHAAYAGAREAELGAALAHAGVRPVRVRIGLPDQDAALHLRALTTALARIFGQHAIGAVLTHAYEGGHPDHDATACAVHRAAAGLPVTEFPLYNAAPGAMQVQRFLPGPPETTVHLTQAETAGKCAMLACFRTQSATIAPFDPATERFRPAPAPDFTRPPHDGELNYERWGWDLTGVHWRALAAAAVETAMPDPACAD